MFYRLKPIKIISAQWYYFRLFRNVWLEEGKLISSDVLWTSMNIWSDITTHLYSASYINDPNVWNATLHHSSCLHDSKQKQSVCLLVTNTTHFTIFFLCLWPFKQGLLGPDVNMNIWMAPKLEKARRPGYVTNHCWRYWSYSSTSTGLSLCYSPNPTSLHTRKAQLKNKYI